MKKTTILVVLTGIGLLASDRSFAQPGNENPYKKAHDAIQKIGGVSGFGADTATSAITSINFGRPGQNNDQVMREVMKHRYGLGALRELRVTYAELTDVGMKEIQGLHGLQFLNLQFNRITDAGLTELKELPNLR